MVMDTTYLSADLRGRGARRVAHLATSLVVTL
jgi:hypothetical protein